MHHLSGFDAMFLYAETPRTHMHTLKVLVFDLPEARGEELRTDVIRRLTTQLHRLPALSMMPVEVPYGLGHPVWKTVRPDVPEHVRAVHLDDAPRAREEAVGEFLSSPLRRDRPLWEALVIADETRGELSLAFKIHHALADGKAAEHMLEIAGGLARAAVEERVNLWPTDGVRRLAARGLRRTLEAGLGVGRLLGRTARGAYRRVARQAELHASVTLPFTSPAAHFARPVTSRRHLAFVSLPFAQVRAVTEAADVKVNDVVLAVCAEGLRRYMRRRGEPVERPLVAAMPIGVRRSAYSFGNHLSNLFLPIHVQEDEPLARLRRSARSAADAKELHAAMGDELLEDWSELSVPFALRGLWAAVRATRQVPAALVVSNVPGPRRGLAIGGAPLRDLYSVGPLLETTGLNLTFWSYDGRLNGCVLMCPDHGGDPHELAADLEAALDALEEAVAPSARARADPCRV